MKKVKPHYLCLIFTIAFLVGCRTPQPPAPQTSANEATEATKRDIARIFNLMGVAAQTYEFDLKTNEVLLVHFHAQKNGVDEKGDTFTQEMIYPHYEKFDRNYPTFEPQKEKRTIDVEILQPGHSWNPDDVKVSVRMPTYHRFFHFDPPNNSKTVFNPQRRIERNQKHRLLDLRYSYKNGDVRTLTVEAEIIPGKKGD